MARRRRTPTKEGQRRISQKIAKLKREGKTTDQAAGAAYAMEREGRLGPQGGLRRGKKKAKRKRRPPRRP